MDAALRRQHEISMQRGETNVDDLFEDVVDFSLPFYSGSSHSMSQIVQDQIDLILINDVLAFNDFAESIIGLGPPIIHENVGLT